MNQKSKFVWLTIDTDDINHHPRRYGHPKRTKNKIKNLKEWNPSPRLAISMLKFNEWYFNNTIKHSVTLFVIAEQLESKIFRDWLLELLSASKKGNGEINVGCHGLKHKCWSAWGEDYEEEFKRDLKIACSKISSIVGEFWRPWFRAPGGYIAPWMVKIIKECNLELDTSINPTKLLNRKSGKSNIRNRKWNGWDSVLQSIEEEGIIEREWFTSKFFGIKVPCCGPALHIPFLRKISNRAWYNLLKSYTLASEKEITNLEDDVVTLYWHLLDYSRKNGNWRPPYL